MGVSILYIEPNVKFQEELSELLRNYANSELYIATNTYDAWQIYQGKKPDIIITEISIGEPNGIDLAREIKSLNPEQSIIFLTTNKRSKYLLLAMNINPDAYILKSTYEEILPKKLQQIISSITKRKREDIQKVILNEIAQSDDKIRMVFDENMKAIFFSIGALKILDITMPDEYMDGVNSIDTRFVAIQDCFYPESIDGSSWIFESKILPNEKRVVAIKDKTNSILQYYLIEISFINESNHTIILLSDITNLFLKHSQFKKKAFTDELTGIHNRAMLNHILPAYIKSVPLDSGLAIIMIDLDHFKNINDKYGHQVGDKILIQLSSVLKQESRETDLLVRWGGEEFLMIVPFIDTNGIIEIAQSIKQRVNNSAFTQSISVTCSYGIAFKDETDTIESWLQKADTELYRAKANGRNRIEIST